VVTRNLIAVYSDGNYKLAQYCLWDGSPRGQGIDVLKFFRNYLKKKKRFIDLLVSRMEWHCLLLVESLPSDEYFLEELRKVIENE